MKKLFIITIFAFGALSACSSDANQELDTTTEMETTAPMMQEEISADSIVIPADTTMTAEEAAHGHKH